MATKCNTQKQLANALGVTPPTVSKYLNRIDWPVRRTRPWTPDHVEKVRAWQVSLQDDRSGKRGPIESAANAGGRDWGVTKLKGQAISAVARGEQDAMKAKLLKGELVEQHVLEQALNGVTSIFVRALNSMVASAPSQLAGDRKTNRRALEQIVRRIREDLVNQREIELVNIEEYTKLVIQGKKKT